jgi:hypothetical protein
MYGNVERRKHGEGYIGFAPLSGAWRIRKNGKSGWIAIHSALVPVAGPGIFFGDRLKDISDELRTR